MLVKLTQYVKLNDGLLLRFFLLIERKEFRGKTSKVSSTQEVFFLFRTSKKLTKAKKILFLVRYLKQWIKLLRKSEIIFGISSHL